MNSCATDDMMSRTCTCLVIDELRQITIMQQNTMQPCNAIERGNSLLLPNHCLSRPLLFIGLVENKPYKATTETVVVTIETQNS